MPAPVPTVRLAAAAAAVALTGCQSPGPNPFTPAPVKATATGTPATGFLLGSPMGVTSKYAPDIQVKAAGFTPGPPPNLPAGLPSPAFDLLVATLTENLPNQPVESPLLAMTLGQDVIVTAEEYITANQWDEAPASPAGTYPVLEVGKHGWYAIEFSVNSSELGASPDLAPDLGTAAGRDSSVFCYVLPASTLALLPNEQQSVCVLKAAMLGLTQAGDELHALNLHMGIYYTDLTTYPHVFTMRKVPVEPSVYFSLRPEFILEIGANAIRAAWKLPMSAPIDSATIYRSDSKDDKWLLPSVHATATSLALPNAAAWTYVFDGLALDTKETADPSDDELLYSLRETASVEVPPEAQMMHVAPGKPPRRIVVRKGNKYGTLGRQMRAGRGHGDFCTADPWIYVKDADEAAKRDKRGAEAAAAAAGASSVRAAPLLVDDFLIARRIPDPAQVPTLSIAGYRALVDARPVMRMCAAAPLAIPGATTAVVKWGYMADLTDPASVVFVAQDKVELQFHGKPFTFDRPLPEGWLRSGPSIPPPPPNPLQAFVMQWSVTVGRATWYSPIAALRF